MKIVVSGPIGCGKSTAAQRAMDALGWKDPAGFYTRREPDALHIGAWRGGCVPFARRAEPPRAGHPSYKPDLDALSRFALPTLRTESEAAPVVIDELGVLELPSSQLTAAIAALFLRPNPVLAVIQQRALESWLAIVGRANVDDILLVDAAGRDSMPARLAALFRNA